MIRLFFLFFVCAGVPIADALEKKEMILLSPSQKQMELSVEVAESKEERRKGLMFREELAEGTGMIFTFDKPQKVTMWMKNTLIPLDMLFIKEGKVKHIHKNAVPHSLDIISSMHSIDTVLEVPGGYSDKYGVDTNWLLLEKKMSNQHKVNPCYYPQTEPCY